RGPNRSSSTSAVPPTCLPSTHTATREEETRQLVKALHRPLAPLFAPGGCPMKPTHCLAALLAVALCLSLSAAREKPAEPPPTVKVYLAAEHAPEGLKAGSKANLVMVTGSVVLKGRKPFYKTTPVAEGVEVVSVKREKKPESPDKAVLVELKATKD